MTVSDDLEELIGCPDLYLYILVPENEDMVTTKAGDCDSNSFLKLIEN